MRSPEPPPPWVFWVAFPTLWLTGSLIIANVGGWAALARRFRLHEPLPSGRWRFQSAGMRWTTRYGACLTVAANHLGLYLSVFPLFRLGHPPLFIPWTEISLAVVDMWGFPIKGRRRGRWRFELVEFRLGRELQIPLRVRPKLADRLKAAAGPAWPAEPMR